ncbi:MAG TPA: hypothetical protein VHX60_01575 [Acidobacteriaceae bacterium]|jgi:hypothetical protein|nr:hypothetical protein [Acidobacteriaceae bacterium]
MPCLELKVAAENLPLPATRLRALLEKPGASVLRRNYVAEVEGHEEPELRNRFRIAAVLAVDLSNPPQDPEPPAPTVEGEEPAEAPAPVEEESDPLTGSFAKGLEIWIADGVRTTCIHADQDEIPGALAMFDAYLRLARYQPAFLRLDQRIIGLHYSFREGLSIGVHGTPSAADPTADLLFEVVSPIPEVNDFRASSFVIRLPNASIGYFHDLLRAASVWLDENSYPNILGSK